ncbi:MAG: hypothetical protein IIZ19_01490, partial [Clostridia bacterium]|nr:hypothetical protein [Clostridia bacterium]
MKKKAVSLIIALCMVITMLPVMGMAANGQTMTDEKTGEAVSYTNDKNNITVSGDVSANAPVFVSVYDENGKMVSIRMMSEAGTVNVSGGDSAKLIWVNAVDFAAKSESAELTLDRTIPAPVEIISITEEN